MKIAIFDHVSSRLGGAQHVVARMAEVLAPSHEVEVIHSGRGYALASLGEAFGASLRGVRERVFEDGLDGFGIPGRERWWAMNAGARDRALTKGYDLFIYSGHGAPPFSSAERGLAYCHFPFEARPTVELADEPRWRHRPLLDRALRGRFYEYLWRRRLRGYDTVLANSRFTASWIERRWGVRARILYPPVVLAPPQAAKQDTIVALGRFIEADRKLFRPQLDAFAAFRKKAGSHWSLSLIGFCAQYDEDRAYLAALQEAARDLPVTFLVNASRETIEAQLGAAKLFWHTVGFPEGGIRFEPQDAEHFGIATVEAMLAGCVPIVPAQGGQPEIVEHGVNGFLCRNLEELVEHSIRLAAGDGRRAALALRAAARGRDFGLEVFRDQFLKAVEAPERRTATHRRRA